MTMNWITEKLKLRNILICIGLIILGLASRKFQSYFPDFVNLYLGDAIWAMMVYYFLRTFFFSSEIWKHGLLSLAYCYLTEISQLYHSDWIESIRNTRIGGLILGFGFLWSDIVSYSLGILVACILEQFLLKKSLN